MSSASSTNVNAFVIVRSCSRVLPAFWTNMTLVAICGTVTSRTSGRTTSSLPVGAEISGESPDGTGSSSPSCPGNGDGLPASGVLNPDNVFAGV